MRNTNITINLAGDFYVPNIEDWTIDSQLYSILQEGDINGINFEAPVRTEGTIPIKKSGPSLCQDPKAPQWLIKKGVNLFDCANNHIFDYGTASLLHTLESIDFPALAVGVGQFYDAYTIKTIEVKGKKIGFLALTQFEFGVHDEEIFTNQEFKAAWMCHPIVDEIISEAHKRCDVLIVLPHAGLEHFILPLPELRSLYRHFISMGADAVVASHPHVPQPWEHYKGKPIFYSLGNFCFDMSVRNRPLWYNGLIAQLQLETDNILRSKVIPVRFSTSNKTVAVNRDESFDKYMDETSDVFRNEELYLNRVNDYCLSLYPSYKAIMEMGGCFQVSSVKDAMSLMRRQIIAKLKCQKAVYNDAHFINTIRCETHRWVMSRIYELRNRY